MFTEEFKYYKSKNSLRKLDSVLNFNCTNSLKDKVRYVTCTEPEVEPLNGLKPVQQWESYELINHPGLIFIKNPFTSSGQRCWIVRCLRDYTKRPNRLNLDFHGLIPDNDEWWQLCQASKDKKLIDKLRWTTLGYHHNWDTKVYSDDAKSDFPSDLALLTKYVASSVGYNNFTAEAAIVNYYHMNSTLSGHTDHSEQYLEAPLFSFSFGQSAIFLLGGTSLAHKPTAMFLSSGDIVVMSKESRLCYHGIPKILPALEAPWNKNDVQDSDRSIKATQSEILAECNDENFWRPFDEYVNHSRININVRQVLRSGYKCLTRQ